VQRLIWILLPKAIEYHRHRILVPLGVLRQTLRTRGLHCVEESHIDI